MKYLWSAFLGLTLLITAFLPFEDFQKALLTVLALGFIGLIEAQH